MIKLGLSNSPSNTSTDPSATVLQTISEVAAWCSDPLSAAYKLRSSQLDPSTILNIPPFSDLPSIQAWSQAKQASFHQAVAQINQTRSKLLRDSKIQIPTTAEAQSKGKLLLYEPLETVSDGAAEASSRGFFDLEDAPPWDTWFLYFNRTIFSWIPEPFIRAAQDGIDSNPVDCIRWANWSDLPHLLS